MKSSSDSWNAPAPPGLAAWLLQRLRGGFGPIRSDRRMRVAETLPLGGKRHLMLVICDRQRFLIGAGADTVSTIVALGAEDESAS